MNIFFELENVSGANQVAPTVDMRFLDANGTEVANPTNNAPVYYAKLFRRFGNDPLPIYPADALTVAWGYPDLGSTDAHTQVATVEYTINGFSLMGVDQTEVVMVSSNLAFWTNYLYLRCI